MAYYIRSLIDDSAKPDIKGITDPGAMLKTLQRAYKPDATIQKH
jgi:hypothetical protein